MFYNFSMLKIFFNGLLFDCINYVTTIRSIRSMLFVCFTVV